MRPPIYVRPLTDAERDALAAGLRSPDAFVLRRCQILLASARRRISRVIGEQLGCNDQTVRNAIAAFNARGLDALHPGSSRPHATHPAFDAEGVAWVRSGWSRIAEFGNGSTYLNFTGLADEATDTGVDSALGRNLRRLAEVKAAYDPDNFFRRNNNIAPA